MNTDPGRPVVEIIDERRGVFMRLNPYRAGTYLRSQWDAGQMHDPAGEHIRFRVDVTEPIASRQHRSQEDHAAPRGADVCVDLGWYRVELARRLRT